MLFCTVFLLISLPLRLCFLESSVCTEMTGLCQELYKGVLKKIKVGMFVKSNTCSLNSCCFYAVLDFFFSFYPLNHTTMSLLKVTRHKYSAKTNTSQDNFNIWCLECLFLYVGNTGVWNVPRIDPCLFIKSLLNNLRLFLWMSQY